MPHNSKREEDQQTRLSTRTKRSPQTIRSSHPINTIFDEALADFTSEASQSCHSREQLTDITSSNKKRKLSRQDIPESQISTAVSDLNSSSSPTSQSTQPSSPAPPLPPEPTSNRRSSPSPPRPIPQHLALEGAGGGRSPTPELSSSTASSPSAAYAGLSLGSEGQGDLATSDIAGTYDTAKVSGKSKLRSSQSLLGRSSSPAKRPAAIMDDPTATPLSLDTDTACNTDARPPELVGDSAERTATNTSRRMTQSQNTRHKRETSVDMLADEASGTLEENHKDQNLATGEESIPNVAYLTPQSGASSANSSHEASNGSPTRQDQAPSVDEQIALVMRLALQPLEEGQKGYVIASTWLSRVLSRGSDAEKAEKYGKEVGEGDIGPVDNTGINLVTDPSMNGLLDEAGEPFIPLRPGLQLSEDFEIIPQGAWELIIKWYGLAKGSPIITRYCHNTSSNEMMENLQYELFPPVFTILKLPHRADGITTQVLKEKDAPPIKILASRQETFQRFMKRIKASSGISLSTKVRVWRILGGLTQSPKDGMMTPAQSRSTSPVSSSVTAVDAGTHLVIDTNKFSALQLGSQRELIEAKDETNNENYNGHKDLSLVGLSRDEVIVLEEQIGGPAGGEWVSETLGNQGIRNGVPISVTKNGATSVQDSLKPKANVASGRSSPVSANGGYMTRGRLQKSGKTRGTTGLSNLGNTCYMNSALQCVRSVEELTQYFLQGRYKKELNPKNPLSHNGEVAKAYASLLQEIFGENAASSFPPRAFKHCIGKYGPSFSGYGQQDSQEFLLFLLDGLQEDLNRIFKKPYIEKPDSTDEMVHDNAALRQMADKCWDIYKARNDSVITDLFAGMYKSTVVCPVCDKVSIIFDPFNNLTLQLPIENVWTKTIFFFPLYSRPIRVAVDIDKNATFMALKEYVAKRTDVDPKRLVIAEIYKQRFFKMFDDKVSISEERIQEADNIGIFELEEVPSNYPSPKKKGQKVRSMILTSYNNSDEEEDLPEGDSPLAERMLVGVFNRVIKDGPSRYQQKALFGVPSYIIVNREEAKDPDAILRKVLAAVATMTTRDILKDEDAPSSESTRQDDSDAVLMNTDDADSSSESKVQANSVESEDGMVDISMRDASEGSQATPRVSYPPRLRQIKRKPDMLRPGSFMTSAVRNLFEMKYFSGTEMIPTGWSALQDESKNYPTIASRIPQSIRRPKRTPRERLARHLDRNGSSTSSDEDIDDVPQLIHNSNSLDQDSGSESDGLPPVESLVKAPARGFGRFSRYTPRDKSGLITYSRKGKRSVNAPSSEDSSTEGATDVPLIRLGEAIILDWNPEAHNALFLASEPEDDDMRGAPTWEDVPLLPDPELERKRQLRSSRKRHGVSLDDCLNEFGKAEILSENDAWYCPRCKEHRRASKKFELWKAPDILVIHLKRFSAQGRLRDKLDVFVDFPVEGLDLSSRVAVLEDDKSPIYDLFAVDNHYGGLGGGHYTAFAQNFFDKQWYEYNDSCVTRRQNSQAVVTSAAYLLFYRRRSDVPLGGEFFEQVINSANSSAPRSQPVSRTESPAGEGRRLDDSSRNGSSSALHRVGAAHQAGGGGLAGGMIVRNVDDVDDMELPGYSSSFATTQAVETLESMDMDEADEGIGGMQGPYSAFSQPSWSFNQLAEGTVDDVQGPILKIHAPPTSDEEDLFDDASNKAVSSAGSVDNEQRLLTDFAEDEGTTVFPSGDDESGGHGHSMVRSVRPSMEDEEDKEVTEVHVGAGDTRFKMD